MSELYLWTVCVTLIYIHSRSLMYVKVSPSSSEHMWSSTLDPWVSSLRSVSLQGCNCHNHHHPMNRYLWRMSLRLRKGVSLQRAGVCVIRDTSPLTQKTLTTHHLNPTSTRSSRLSRWILLKRGGRHFSEKSQSSANVRGTQSDLGPHFNGPSNGRGYLVTER